MELYKTALANRYYRAAFYVGMLLESNPKNKKIALGYYKEGAAARDSACHYVSLSVV